MEDQNSARFFRDIRHKTVKESKVALLNSACLRQLSHNTINKLWTCEFFCLSGSFEIFNLRSNLITQSSFFDPSPFFARALCGAPGTWFFMFSMFFRSKPSVCVRLNLILAWTPLFSSYGEIKGPERAISCLFLVAIFRFSAQNSKFQEAWSPVHFSYSVTRGVGVVPRDWAKWPFVTRLHLMFALSKNHTSLG